jgi:hypothetical protein
MPSRATTSGKDSNLGVGTRPTPSRAVSSGQNSNLNAGIRVMSNGIFSFGNIGTQNSRVASSYTYTLSSFNNLISNSINGNIIITQDPILADSLKVICRAQPKYDRNNNLVTNTTNEDIKIIIPSNFYKPFTLKTTNGNIISRTPLQSAGMIKTTNGDINIRIDSKCVKALTHTTFGNITSNIIKGMANNRNILHLETINGDIRVKN